MNPTEMVGTSLGSVKDTKSFSELTIDEKVERLAIELRNSRYLANRVIELGQKVHRFERHSHCGGKVVVELNDINNSFGLGPCSAQTRDLLT